MGKSNVNKLDGKSLWAKKPASITAAKNLDLVLDAARNLPLLYWRPGFFFIGAKDKELLKLTDDHFPRKFVRGKTHPVYSLTPLPNNSGFKVCPCSSKKPFKKTKYRYIKKGCRLLHTGFEMDRNSFLIEGVKFNIPSTLAYQLLFKGQVPSRCLI